MSGTYNPPWKGDLSRGFWDCGHWYDFPDITAPESVQDAHILVATDAGGNSVTRLYKNDSAYIVPGKDTTTVPSRLRDYLQALHRIEKRVKMFGVTEDAYTELADAHMSCRIDAHDLKELDVDISDTMKRMLLEMNRRERKEERNALYKLSMPDVGTATVSTAKIKPLTLDDIKGVRDKLLAAGLMPHKNILQYDPLPQLHEAFYKNTGMRLYWNKTVPQHGVTLILRTIGGVPVIGQWTGEYGQYFDAWAYLPTDGPKPDMINLKGAESDYT